MFQAILPELSILILALVVLTVDLLSRKEHHRRTGWVSLGGILVTLVITLLFVPYPQSSQLIFGNMMRIDTVTWLLRLVLMSGAGLTILFSMVNQELYSKGEFYVLLLFSLLGMMLMVSAADLMMLFLAIETTTIPLFILAGFVIDDQKSVEAGIKYFLFGVVASAVMLYGFSLLFGFSGTTQIDLIASKMVDNHIPLVAIIFTLVLVLAGLGFKISAVPFQFWAPDVYEGAPTPIAGYLSTASKLAGFVVLMRVVFSIFSSFNIPWMPLIAALSIGSMVVGNLLALSQKNIKRFLAYSSIAQAGYILVGVTAGTVNGISGTLYYLIAYLFTNLAVFGVVVIVSRAIGSDEISAFAGLSRRSPFLAFLMLIGILSLAGIPPFSGFVGKLLVFSAAIENGQSWLVFIAIINTMVGLYYYLNILKVIYLYRSEGEGKQMSPSGYGVAALTLCVIGIVVMGVVIAPWYSLTHVMAMNILLLP
jgi:NADH-quinone oxidoreductase subunit N